MAHIECHSYVTGRDIKYPLIGVKLKHKKKQEDYGAQCPSNNRELLNTSPDGILNPIVTGQPYGYGEPTIDQQIYRTTGVTGRGTLESEYENHNNGVNPIIVSSTYDVNEFEVGLNTRDLFETDTVKVLLEVHKCKVSDINYHAEGLREQAWIKLDDKNMEVIYKVYIKYILKVNNSTVGYYDMGISGRGIYPITFSISTELWCIKDFNPKYKTTMGFSSSYNWDIDYSDGKDNNGVYVEGMKSQNASDFIGASFTMLCSECWSNIYDSDVGQYEHFKITKDNVKIKNSDLRVLTSNAGILYYRNMIKTDPNNFIVLNTKKTSTSTWTTAPPNQIEWANNVLITDEYELKSDTYETQSGVFNILNFMATSILMPCVKPDTFEAITNNKQEGMFISLTNNILEGPAPDQDPDPEPPDPETVEPADNPETKYTPQESDGNKEFEYPGMDDIPKGPAALNAYRNSYSNFIFSHFYHEAEITGPTVDPAIQFITDAANPSAFELWGATFKLLSGHPTPDEIISRVYYLPFEYNEIRFTENEPGYPVIDMTVKAAPVYGPVGPLTMGAKEYTGSNKDTGEPITSNIHYYDLMIGRFKEMDLGTTTITRVFNNFMDYSDVKYTLKLPYGAGDVALDPDFLFMNGISNGTVSLKGYLDFDTGELSIIILVNDHLYHETIVSVAIDRLANVEDKMAGPLAIGKAIAGAAATAGGIAKFAGGGGGGMSIPQIEDPRYDDPEFMKAKMHALAELEGRADPPEIEALKKKYQ